MKLQQQQQQLFVLIKMCRHGNDFHFAGLLRVEIIQHVTRRHKNDSVVLTQSRRKDVWFCPIFMILNACYNFNI